MVITKAWCIEITKRRIDNAAFGRANPPKECTTVEIVQFLVNEGGLPLGRALSVSSFSNKRSFSCYSSCTLAPEKGNLTMKAFCFVS
jgi:hypothetical protein